MSRIVSPYGRPTLTIPSEASWWRSALINTNEHGHLYVISRDGDDNIDTTTWMTLDWFDGRNTILDAGLDRPTVYEVGFVYIEPVEYLDLLSVDRPTPDFYRITERGVHVHPGMIIVADLDQVPYKEE